MAETKSINFNHQTGHISSNGECIGYLRSQDKWERVTSKFYKLLDSLPPSELVEWNVSSQAYQQGNCVKLNNTAYYCLHDNIPSITPVENNPKIWRNYSDYFKTIKKNDIIGVYNSYYNYFKNSENLSSSWKFNSLITTKNSESLINGKPSWIIQSDVSLEPSEHSFGQSLKFNENTRIGFSAFIQQNVSRTVGLGFKILNDPRLITYIARYDIQLGTVIDLKAYDSNLSEITDPNLLTDVSARIQIIDMETYTYRVSLFGKTTQETYLDCKVFLIGDAPSYDIKFVSSIATGFHILNVNFMQAEITANPLPSVYVKSEAKPMKGYQPIKFYQKSGDGFTDYKLVFSKLHFATELKNVHNMVNGDYAFIANGIYFPDGTYLGELNDYQAEIDTLMYKNLFTDKYTISVNDEHYTLETGFDYKPKLVDALTFNKYGYQRVAGYFKIC